MNTSIYSFKLPKSNGGIIDFSDFKGKKILIVNTASKCGFTHQYEDLEKLYRSHQEKLIVIGCPSNQFLFQEPGDNNTITNFCQLNFGITFPISEKIKVRGNKSHPLFKWLKKESKTKDLKSTPRWNFHKFLLDEKGQLIGSYRSSVKPQSKELIDLI